MFLNAKNENIRFNGHDCDFISFGSGKDVLIMLPGVGDGFRTAKGVASAIPGAELYMYEGYSHGVYEQAKDFNSRVLEYLIRQK